MREADAKPTYRLVATWGTAVLVGLAMLVSAGAHPILAIMTTQTFHGAAAMMPWIAVGVVLQGIYLLTSIGLNITKRTEFYPAATGLAAVTSIGAGLALVPGYGVQGAAAANALSYAVLATASAVFAHRVYPVDYEWGRMAQLAAAGICGYAAAVFAVPGAWAHVPALLARIAVASLVYLGVLVVTGFATTIERQQLLACDPSQVEASRPDPSCGGVRDDGTGGQRGVGHRRRDHRGAAGC